MASTACRLSGVRFFLLDFSSNADPVPAEVLGPVQGPVSFFHQHFQLSFIPDRNPCRRSETDGHTVHPLCDRGAGFHESPESFGNLSGLVRFDLGEQGGKLSTTQPADQVSTFQDTGK